MRRVIILGSTGSIGTQALDVVRSNPDRFDVVGLAASGLRLDLLVEQIQEFSPAIVAVSRPSTASDIQLKLYAWAKARGFSSGDASVPELIAGPESLIDISRHKCDVLVNGLSGAIGLEPTLAALQTGSSVALANKESLIIGGDLVRSVASPEQIIPVDSEHSAIAQCLRAGVRDEVRRLILTASGGPFRGARREDLANVTASQALAHPTWSMGPLVTVNSATMMNKGLEVIEAHLLFDIAFPDISVVVHPQSVVHSMVEFVDGSTICQASPPDMRLPIALGMDWSSRVANAAPACSWDSEAAWEFFPVDDAAFPAVNLAREAGAAGGTAPAVLNAANEVCVEKFLEGELPFLGIVDHTAALVEEHLQGGSHAPCPWVPPGELTLEDVLFADSWTRDRCHELIRTA